MNRRILKLAIPNILSNLSVPLLSSVDTAVVGHLDNVSYIGAIAIGSMIFNFLYWGFGFLRMGTTGLTAQAFGKHNKQDIITVLARSLSVAVAAGVILFSFQYFIKEISFYLVDGSKDVETFAKQYFDIRIFAAPATLSLYAFHGWFLGMQNARYPLILTVFVNVLNVFFNLFFIYHAGMNSDGVALGTVCAQYSGLVLAVVLYLKKYKGLTAELVVKRILRLEELKKFFSVNFDIFIRTLCLIFSFSFFTAQSAEFGTNVLASNTILMELWMILSYGIDGFAYSAESLVGRFIGSGDKEKVKSAVKYSFYWGVGLGLGFTVVYLLFGRSILWLYTDNKDLISLAMVFFPWVVIAPITNSFCYLWDGVFIGATATKPMRNSMLISVFLVFLPIYYFSKGAIGNHALWLALVGLMLARGASLTVLAPKYIFARLKS